MLQRLSDAHEVEALLPRIASAREVARQREVEVQAAAARSAEAERLRVALQERRRQEFGFFQQPLPPAFYQPHPPQRVAPVRQALAVTFRRGAPSPSSVCAQATVVSSAPALPLAVEAVQTRQEEEEEEAADADAAGERARRAGAAAIVARQWRQSKEAESAAAAARLDVFPRERLGGHRLGEMGLQPGYPTSNSGAGGEPHRALCVFEAGVRAQGVQQTYEATVRPRCDSPGCSKIAQGYRSGKCGEHGGVRTPGVRKDTSWSTARRCDSPECGKFSQGRSGKCIAHGGGTRCTVSGCTKSARGNTGKCAAHGN
jgi:hypothetical protein